MPNKLLTLFFHFTILIHIPTKMSNISHKKKVGSVTKLGNQISYVRNPVVIRINLIN